MSNAPQKRRRIWEIDKRCYWCHLPTAWWDGIGSGPLDAATWDHLYRAADPRRLVEPGGVVSCRKCNMSRGATAGPGNDIPAQPEVPPGLTGKLVGVRVEEEVPRGSDFFLPRPATGPKRRLLLKILWIFTLEYVTE
jgi:hypothetical protein